MLKGKNLFLSILTFIFSVSIATPAYAYLDPGTGSIILQGIIAGLAVFSLTIKMWWYKLTSLFKNSDDEEQKDSDESESSTPD